MNNWKKIVVSPTTTLLDSMKIIDAAGTQFVMVLDDQDRLTGVLTDGDIRRAILNNIPLSAFVKVAMNPNPRSLPSHTNIVDALRLLEELHITHVPLVNKDKVVTGVVSIDERLNLSGNQNTAVLMVGGLGSRLGDLTTNCPKPMLKIAGRPVLEIILENLRKHGFRDFIFCVNYKAEMIQEHFGDGSSLGVKIRYVHEPKKMGTAGALGLLPKDVEGPFLVMNGDIVTMVNFTRLMDFHREKKVNATMCVRKYDFQIPYGVVKTKDGQITGIDEKPVHNFLVSAGIYVLEKDCLNSLPDGETCDMPQLFESMMKEQKHTQVFPIHEYWLDIGREDDLNRAHVDYTEINKDKE